MRVFILISNTYICDAVRCVSNTNSNTSICDNSSINNLPLSGLIIRPAIEYREEKSPNPVELYFVFVKKYDQVVTKTKHEIGQKRREWGKSFVFVTSKSTCHQRKLDSGES